MNDITEEMIDNALKAEIRTNAFSWTLQELFNDRASRSTLNQADMRNAMRQILALGTTSTRQTPDAVREAILKYTQHYVGCAVYGSWANGEPKCSCGLDEARASLAALDSRAGDAGEGDREALAGYRAAVSFISADSWDGCGDCMEILKAARAADWQNEQAANLDETARQLARIRKHRPDYAATPAPAVDAQEEAEHIRQTEMQEIADGAYGDGPAMRWRAARDYLGAVDAVPAGEDADLARHIEVMRRAIPDFLFPTDSTDPAAIEKSLAMVCRYWLWGDNISAKIRATVIGALAKGRLPRES